MEVLTEEEKQKTKPKSARQLYFDMCAMRAECLSPDVWAVLQMQIQQLLFNAENPHLPQQQVISMTERTTPHHNAWGWGDGYMPSQPANNTGR